MAAYERPLVNEVWDGLHRLPELIHVVAGPRQVGKTTVAQTIADRWPWSKHFAAADETFPPSAEWIRNQWQQVQRLEEKKPCLLVLDEIQKIRGWSEVLKGLWDAARRRHDAPRVLVLGSSALLLTQGTNESLAGRFFLHRCHHWSWAECRAAFGWNLDRWLYFGGYPGAARIADADELQWRNYVRDSLVEAVLSRDVLSLQRITKPALLRHLFALSCRFPAQALSYTKMLGQLQDAGNTTTLANYLNLLGTAFLLRGLDRFSAGQARSRGSTPKLVVWNNALVSALNTFTFEQARADTTWWGHLVENAVGAHLASRLDSLSYGLCWWREGNDEVDFVVTSGRKAWAVEVKSGREKRATGLTAFCKRFPRATPLLIGSGGMPLENFFEADPARLFT